MNYGNRGLMRSTPPGENSFLKDDPTYESESTGDHGFVYQRELMIYFALNLEKLTNEWCCGFEVKEYKKFDDIVFEFKLNGEKHIYFIQAKHTELKKTLTLEHLLENFTESKRGNDDVTKRNFALINYSNAVKTYGLANDLKRKFLLLTNYPVNLVTTEFGPKMVKAPEIANGETGEIAMLFTDIKVKDLTKFTKFPKTIELIDKTKIDDVDFLENFILITGLPNMPKLVTINDKLLEAKFMSKHCAAMKKAVFKEIEVTKDNSQPKSVIRRPKLTRDNFNKAILNSILEEDLPIYTNDFQNQFPNWLDISGKSLQKLPNAVNKIYTKGNAKLVTFMLYKRIMQQQSQLKGQPPYCIPYSKLNAIMKKALMTSERKVVVYVESKDANEDFKKYKNAIFVIQTNVESTPNMICTFEDLTKDAQEGLKRTFVKFQGFDVKIKDLTDDNVFLTEILQEVCNAKKMLEFGTKLPLDKLPKYYINRLFKLNTNEEQGNKDQDNKDKSKEGQKEVKPKINEPISEEKIFEQGQNIIIQGLGGIGKSTSMIKLAEEVKKSNPNFFVYFVELIAHSSAFREAKDQEIKIIGPNDGQTAKTKNIDAWNFVLSYFLEFYGKNKKIEQIVDKMGEIGNERKLEKCLLDIYAKKENPKILIILDGFDEIAPIYNAQVIQIVNSLKQRKVQMYVSSQSHLKNKMKELKFQKTYTLEPYNNLMQGDFLRLYWTNYLEEKQKNNTMNEKVDKNQINVYTKKFFDMCYKSLLSDITTRIPLMLNILADIYKDECIEFCVNIDKTKKSDKTRKRKPIEFLEINVLKVYEQIFQDNCRKFNRKRKTDESLVYFAQIEKETSEEWRKRYMSIAIEDRAGEVWKQQQGALVKKNWSEVYGRGFITGETMDDYTFIYCDFKEYFAADWFTRQIFPPGGSININLLKRFLKKDGDSVEQNPENYIMRIFGNIINSIMANIKSVIVSETNDNQDENDKEKKNEFSKKLKHFVYRFVLEKLTELKENKDLALSPQEKAQASEFILGFFHYAWFNRESSQIEIIFELAKTFCTKEAVQKICKDMNLLKKVPFTSPAQLKVSIEIYDHYFGPNETNAILKSLDCKSDIEKIIMKLHFSLYEEYVNTMTTRDIFKEKHFIPETYKIFQTYLKKHRVKGWMFVRDVFTWYFSKINETADNIWAEMKDILKEEEFEGRHYLGHKMASFWEWKKYKDDFIERSFEVANKCDHPKNLYRFLYAVNSITREDILKKTVEIMCQKHNKFISKGKNSVLFDAFEDNNSYLLKKLLILLTNAEIEAQICANVCGGTSLTQQCTKGNYLCEVILQELVNKFGSDVTKFFFTTTAKEAKEVEDNLKIFSTFFRKDMKVDGEILKGLTKRLRESCKAKNQLLSLAKNVSSPEALNYIQKY